MPQETPNFTDAAVFKHSASGFTPASGSAAVYVKSDNKLYVKDSSGTEAAAGGGFGEVRFDTSGSYTYTGQAAEGSSESSAVWFIRRSEFSSAGAYVSTTTANNVEWDDRLTASYT